MNAMNTRFRRRALAALLLGVGAFALPAWAQEPPAAAPAESAPAAVDCSGDGCTSDEGAVIRIRTRGAREPVTEPGARGTQALAPDRRVSVEAAEPGKAVAVGKWTVQLPDGGVLWVTEDPNLGQCRRPRWCPSTAAPSPSRCASTPSTTTRPSSSGRKC
jgi:hypothetical protein